VQGVGKKSLVKEFENPRTTRISIIFPRGQSAGGPGRRKEKREELRI